MAGARGVDELRETSGNRKAFGIDAVLTDAVVENAGEMNPFAHVRQVIVNAARDRACAKDGDSLIATARCDQAVEGHMRDVSRHEQHREAAAGPCGFPAEDIA